MRDSNFDRLGLDRAPSGDRDLPNVADLDEAPPAEKSVEPKPD